MGLSVTDYELWGCELDLEVTNAVIADFSANRLFKEAGRKVENPDFIIKGEIKKFCGKYQLNTFAKASSMMLLAGAIVLAATRDPMVSVTFLPALAWYSGIPISTNAAEAVIEM
ncbi:MAG: hypothetical protein CRN43_14580, partial [Candidatus Nephrothrix sp. EaCA]